MKASELRIGNLVDITPVIKKELWEFLEIETTGESFSVCAIELTEVRCQVVSSECEFNYSDIKPIPITKEWLKKFGFENINGYYELDLPHNLTLIEGDKNEYLEVFELFHDTLRCRYVHQLQNLYFALTNKELIINN